MIRCSASRNLFAFLSALSDKLGKRTRNTNNEKDVKLIWMEKSTAVILTIHAEVFLVWELHQKFVLDVHQLYALTFFLNILTH